MAALVRGFLVRQKIKEVRNEFEEVVATLEDKKILHWKKNALGYPLITTDQQFFNGANKVNRTGVSGNVLDHKEDTATVTEVNRCDSRENLVLNSGLCNPCLDDQTTCDANFPICKEDNNVQEMFITEACTDNRVESHNNEKFADGKTVDHSQRKEITPVEIPDFPAALSLSSTSRCSNGDTEDIHLDRLCNGRSDSTDKSPVGVPDENNTFLRGNQILSESWMTEKSFDAVISEESQRFPSDPVQLQQLRDHITMELLWTEQAIQSRKKYLNLKKEILQSDVEEDPSVGWDSELCDQFL